MQNGKNTIKISVIVISDGQSAKLKRCLKSIFHNPIDDKIEILVAGSDSNESLIALKKDFSSINFLKLQQPPKTPVFVSSAIAKSQGEIIALINSSCIAQSDWLSSILKAHQSPALVIGGSVEPLKPMKILDWAAYFCDYSRFMPALKSGASDVVPGNNFSFKRAALEIGKDFIYPEFWKSFWCRKLQNAGQILILEPAIQVHYDSELLLAHFLKKRFHQGRCFAAMRIESVSDFKKLMFICGSFFLPLIFFTRLLSIILEKKRLIKEFFISIPFILLALLSWSCGEFCGCIAGMGKSCDYIE